MNRVVQYFGQNGGAGKVGAGTVPVGSRRRFVSAGAAPAHGEKTVVRRKRRNAGGRSGAGGVEASKAPVETRLHRGDARPAGSAGKRAL